MKKTIISILAVLCSIGYTSAQDNIGNLADESPQKAKVHPEKLFNMLVLQLGVGLGKR